MWLREYKLPDFCCWLCQLNQHELVEQRNSTANLIERNISQARNPDGIVKGGTQRFNMNGKKFPIQKLWLEDEFVIL